MSIAIFDAHYKDTRATTACVLLADWESATAFRTIAVETVVPDDYIPGEFYRRELPGILLAIAAVTALGEVITCAVVDGYVWLEAGHPGLGHHLYQALQESVPVVGVAKTRYQGADSAVTVIRGDSVKPLHVTADGMATDVAAARIHAMAGPFRIPTAIRLADQISKGLVKP